MRPASLTRDGSWRHSKVPLVNRTAKVHRCIVVNEWPTQHVVIRVARYELAVTFLEAKKSEKLGICHPPSPIPTALNVVLTNSRRMNHNMHICVKWWNSRPLLALKCRRNAVAIHQMAETIILTAFRRVAESQRPSVI